MTEHPITPPPELRAQWRQDAPRYRDSGVGREDWLMDRAAQWGADQELEACCSLLELSDDNAREFLQSARRPKPPSLKEQALQALAEADLGSTEAEWSQRFDTIRRALEQLDD